MNRTFCKLLKVSLLSLFFHLLIIESGRTQSCVSQVSISGSPNYTVNGNSVVASSSSTQIYGTISFIDANNCNSGYNVSVNGSWIHYSVDSQGNLLINIDALSGVTGRSGSIRFDYIYYIYIQQNGQNLNVGNPVFSLGTSSVRCQGAGTVTYAATAINSTSINYSLNSSASLAGNTINSSTGTVTYIDGWVGTTIITAIATGNNGSSNSSHTVTITPKVSIPVFALGASSTRCQGAASVTYSASAGNSTGITYSLNGAAISAGNSINSLTGTISYAAGWTGTTIITATAAGCSGPLTATHTVTITPTVGNPSPITTTTEPTCQLTNATTITWYSTESTNSSGYNWSITNTAAGSINPQYGTMTWANGFSGTVNIIVTASGCNGPSNPATRTVIIHPSIGIPSLVTISAGTEPSCQIEANGITTTYSSTVANGTISWGTDNPAAGSMYSNGVMNWTKGFSGTVNISAGAIGCNGPTSSKRLVTIAPSVGVPVFNLGASSTRCQGSGTVSYAATAANSTAITYSLDGTSIAAGNNINSSTGLVTYAAGWSGASIITASANGCNGPKSSNHTVTITPSVGNPIFALGTSSSRCIGAGSVTYTASSSNNTGIVYSLDANSRISGNTINSTTGLVNYVGGWWGDKTIITASASGCNGPATSSHTVINTQGASSPAFNLGSTSTRCQGIESVTYTAMSTNSTGITYILNGSALSAGNTINASTGTVTYVAGWNGITTIAATANGCLGSISSFHTVTITPKVGKPTSIIASGEPTCELSVPGVTTAYSTTASNNSGFTWSISNPAAGSINASTGVMTWAIGYEGSVDIRVVANGCGGPSEQTSRTVILKSSPTLTTQPLDKSVTESSWVTFSALASGSNPFTYQWQKSSDGVVYSNIEGANSPNYKMKATVLTNNFRYHCLVTDGCTTTSYSALLTVNSNPSQNLIPYSPPIPSAENFIHTITPVIKISQNNLSGALLGDTTIIKTNSLKVGSILQEISYFNGLGRSMQIVNYRSSASGRDIILPIKYDSYGRDSVKYLPYSSGYSGAYSENATDDQLAFYTNPGNVSNGLIIDSSPFSRTFFESSPLNRVLEQGSPGASWQPLNGHSVGLGYLTNTATEVKQWSINSANHCVLRTANSGFYDASQLYIVQAKDENGNRNREYKDKEGRVIFKKSYFENDSLQTYYVYDNSGLLRYVISPKAVKDIQATTLKPDDAAVRQLCYYYNYNERNLMVMKQLPGADSVLMVYDARDRLVATQDGNQRASGKWTFMKYDAFNRPVITGIFTPAQTSRVTLQSAVNTYYNTAGKLWFTERMKASTLTYPTGYDLGKGYPEGLAENDVLNITYYDDYDSIPGDRSFSPDADLDANVINTSVKGQVTATRTRVLDGNNTWITTANYYDNKYRIIQSVNTNYIGGIDRMTIQYDFVGKVMKTRLNHTGKVIKTIDKTFEYDHAGRLLKIFHSIDGTAPILMSYMKYNELGELIDKKLHVTDKINYNTYVQSIDYRYNIRGWLKSINNPGLTNDNGASNDDTSDKFGMKLMYDNQ